MLEGIWCNFLIDLENSTLTDVASVIFWGFFARATPTYIF